MYAKRIKTEFIARELAQFNEGKFKIGDECAPLGRGEWPRSEALKIIANKWVAHMTSAVQTGEGLPDERTLDPIKFNTDFGAFLGAGGFILKSSGGLPVSSKAVDQGADLFVFVDYRGMHCAVTIEEAFERGLMELQQVNGPVLTDSEIIEIVLQRIAGIAADKIRTQR